MYFILNGKDHKNMLEFCLKVFAKLNILKQTVWKWIFTFEDIAILCFQNGCQWSMEENVGSDQKSDI